MHNGTDQDLNMGVDIVSSPNIGEGVEVENNRAEAYHWPVLNFNTTPERLYHFHHQFVPSSAADITAANNFLKGIKWSPDGSCLLTCSEDKSLKVFHLPIDSLDATPLLDTDYYYQDSFNSSLTISEGETVYDFCWYPQMLASDPGSCTFVTTCRDHPVHLWDALTGELRCTYRAFDAMDEIAAAYSISFNSAGTKLYCGYNKTIRVFHSARPGRDFQQYSTFTKFNDGQTGIISCLAFNNGGMLAAGSYNRTTALYSEDNLELLYVLHGQQGGVTQVLFSKDGNYLYTGARKLAMNFGDNLYTALMMAEKDPDILCWDVRNTATTLYRLPRITSDTNQRIMFDIEPLGRHLGTGGQDGFVHIYDLQSGDWVTSFAAAADTVNGFSFHPTLPLVAAASGQRRFSLEEDDETYDQEQSQRLKGMGHENHRGSHLKLKRALYETVDENCASIWRFSCTWLNFESIKKDEQAVPNEMQICDPPIV